jgi:hypothetical protein
MLTLEEKGKDVLAYAISVGVVEYDLNDMIELLKANYEMRKVCYRIIDQFNLMK